MNPTIGIFAFLLSILAASFASPADYPAPTEGDYTIRDFPFASGEILPELRLHYRTLGKLEKNAQGKTTNAILIMHGTTGSGAQFIRSEFAGELFDKDQPLDATKFFIVLPDEIREGKFSKLSHAMHAKMPPYGHVNMVQAQHRCGDALVYEQQSGSAAKRSADTRENRRGARQIRRQLHQDRRRQRCAVRGRSVARLRSWCQARRNPRATPRYQFRRRYDQSPG